ncbi:queuosine precursor transporter [Candidatus Peregrinibacteria bacterium]|nr:queuosine precursor transporter [Candidatus Peregrinibacteria bacterium]
MHSKYLQTVGAIFVTTLIVSNIIAVKIGSFGGYFLPVAVVIFPISYILGDILTEVYGYQTMRRIIWTGFLCNLLAVIAIAIARAIPPAPFYQDQQAFDAILGATPRILLASFIAYLIGNFTNSYIMAKMKIKMKIKTSGRYLWTRTIASTIVGEGLDSLLFITIAFAGVFPDAKTILTVAATQWIFKVLFEVIATPVTYGITGWLKKAEQIDTFDLQTNFNPLAF